eukprot:scaffold20193_cov90-Isochrysis_galbana.AAC.1
MAVVFCAAALPASAATRVIFCRDANGEACREAAQPPAGLARRSRQLVSLSSAMATVGGGEKSAFLSLC